MTPLFINMYDRTTRIYSYWLASKLFHKSEWSCVNYSIRYCIAFIQNRKVYLGLTLSLQLLLYWSLIEIVSISSVLFFLISLSNSFTISNPLFSLSLTLSAANVTFLSPFLINHLVFRCFHIYNILIKAK